MIKLIKRVNIYDTLYIYLQDNSKRWYARFVLFGKWYCKSTKQQDEKVVFYVHVRKGKTTKYTGTREIVCRKGISVA